MHVYESYKLDFGGFASFDFYIFRDVILLGKSSIKNIQGDLNNMYHRKVKYVTIWE